MSQCCRKVEEHDENMQTPHTFSVTLRPVLFVTSARLSHPIAFVLHTVQLGDGEAVRTFQTIVFCHHSHELHML